MNQYHLVIGMALLVLLIIQPVLGQIYHRNHKALGRRTAVSHAHLWLGRLAITLGVINGGLGFLLAGNTKSGAIAYSVVAGAFWVIYLGTVVTCEQKDLQTITLSIEKRPSLK
jgi:hypothetical protein